MFSGSLLKGGYANLQDTEARVIDSNELVARRLGLLTDQVSQPGDNESAGETDGFAAGLSADQVEGLSDGEADASVSYVIKGGDSREVLARAREEAERIIEQARARAGEESERIRAEAQEAAAREREDTLARAREEGYSEGLRRAEQELAAEQQKFQQQLARTEAEFQGILDEIEPRLIDAITGIYEHIFHVELESYRDILVYLISATMRKVEGSREFLVHVSKEDYPYVSMQKKQIIAEAASPNSTVEIIEDITLAQNECMIETEGGIFDCGLNTQLADLGRKLRLLAYEGQ